MVFENAVAASMSQRARLLKPAKKKLAQDNYAAYWNTVIRQYLSRLGVFSSFHYVAQFL